MPVKLFISYSSQTSDRVDRIVMLLSTLKDAQGQPLYEVWQDKLPNCIPAGSDWWKVIIDAIIDCDVFIFMMSLDAVQSIPCCAELSYAHKRNRAILPIVLEREFTHNLITGKNDIEFWENVPDELTIIRAQFLFYENISFVARLKVAVDFIRSKPLRDTPAPHPPDPRRGAEANNDYATLYGQACDYALRMELRSADRLFQRIMNSNDPVFSENSSGWLFILRDYEQMVRLHENQNTRFLVKPKWEIYISQFPQSFTQLFDPVGLQIEYSVKPLFDIVIELFGQLGSTLSTIYSEAEEIKKFLNPLLENQPNPETIETWQREIPESMKAKTEDLKCAYKNLADVLMAINNNSISNNYWMSNSQHETSMLSELTSILVTTHGYKKTEVSLRIADIDGLVAMINQGISNIDGTFMPFVSARLNSRFWAVRNDISMSQQLETLLFSGSLLTNFILRSKTLPSRQVVVSLGTIMMRDFIKRIPTNRTLSDFILSIYPELTELNLVLPIIDDNLQIAIADLENNKELAWFEI